MDEIKIADTAQVPFVVSTRRLPAFRIEAYLSSAMDQYPSLLENAMVSSLAGVGPLDPQYKAFIMDYVKTGIMTHALANKLDEEWVVYRAILSMLELKLNVLGYYLAIGTEGMTKEAGIVKAAQGNRVAIYPPEPEPLSFVKARVQGDNISIFAVTRSTNPMLLAADMLALSFFGSYLALDYLEGGQVGYSDYMNGQRITTVSTDMIVTSFESKW